MGQSSLSSRGTISSRGTSVQFRKLKYTLPRMHSFSELCSEPEHPPLEAGEIRFFQEYVGRIAMGEATVRPKD